MIKVLNIDAVFSQWDEWQKQVEAECLKIAIGLAKVTLGKALEASPQYSGDFAANWRLDVNNIVPFFQEGIFPDKEFPTESPYQRRDTPAIRYAIGSNTGRLDSFKFGDTIWLHNSAAHDDLYAWKIEENLLRLRPVNYGGEGPLRQVKEYVKVHFNNISKTSLEFLK
jgi:hypothetical protein